MLEEKRVGGGQKPFFSYSSLSQHLDYFQGIPPQHHHNYEIEDQSNSIVRRHDDIHNDKESA